MSRLATRYLGTTDRCTRCPLDQPLVVPDGTASGTDAEHIAFMYRCDLGHCWQRTFRRSDLKGAPAKATAGQRRRHATLPVTTTAGTTTTTTADCTDESITDRNRAARQPSPKTGWCPDRRAWLPR